MKIYLKYLIAGLLLLVAILIAAIWLNITNQNIDIQEPYPNQLGNCQKITSSYVGLNEQDAVNRADKENRPYRIVSRDGVGFPVTEDYSPDRLNFEISNSLIKKASCG